MVKASGKDPVSSQSWTRVGSIHKSGPSGLVSQVHLFCLSSISCSDYASELGLDNIINMNLYIHTYIKALLKDDRTHQFIVFEVCTMKIMSACDLLQK